MQNASFDGEKGKKRNSDASISRISPTPLSETNLRAFRALFREWQAEWMNCESLEMGGEGNLAELAQMAWEWAQKVREPRH